jgi:exodeoxyribonuclease-3
VRIASWNVNSIKIRLAHLLDWLKQSKTDVVLLQEIKCLDDGFPALEIEALGYNVAVHGQKTYNGVAILSRHPMTVEQRGLPEAPDPTQARYLEAVIQPQTTGGDRRPVRVASIYFPNGNPAPGPKYDHKLAFMAGLEAHARKLLTFEEPLVLGGDYNVIPQPEDVYDPKAWATDALFLPQSRAALRRIVHLGLTDAFRALHAEVAYTFWDYQAGAWQKDHGLRIDHLLLSPQAADRLAASGIDKKPRGWEKPSDHTPVWCELEI